MSTIAITAAKEALTSTAGLSDNVGAPEGKVAGKAVTPWAFKLLIACCVVGAIAAIAAAIFQMWPLMAACILLSATSGFAAFHVKKLAVLNTLEGYTLELSERVKTLSVKSQELKEANKDLEKITGGLKKIPENFRDALVEGEKKLSQMNKERDAAIRKFSTIQETLQEYAEAAIILSEDTGFSGVRVEKLKEVAVNPDSEETIVKAAKRTFKLLKEMFLQEKKKREELVKQLNELLATVPKAVESTAQLQEMTEKYEALIMEFDVKLRKLTKFQDGYKRWKTWLNSQEFQEYQAWKAAQEGVK